jgi:hypothetical protein
MLPGADFLMKRGIFVLPLAFFLFSSVALAQGQGVEDRQDIYAIVKDGQGETMEGYLRLGTDELAVRSKDNQEKTIPVKYIKSITLEKTKDEAPGEDPKREATYTIHLENSQEIYTLHKKYTFSLNTNLGLVTKTIDPDKINSLFSKDGPQSAKIDDGKPFIQDKSVIFSLEFKF